MSTPPPPAGDSKSNGTDNDPKEDKTDYTIAKAAGAVIATGIAWSVFKTFWPKKADDAYEGFGEGIDAAEADVQCAEEKAEGFAEKVTKKFPKFSRKKGQRHEVGFGDTLYGLSRKFGVPVESIKAANNLSSDIIVVGEKLNIPS